MTHHDGWRWRLATCVIVLLCAARALGADYLHEQADLTAPDSSTASFTFTLEEGFTARPRMEVTISLSQGRAEMRMVDPDGNEIDRLSAQDLTIRGYPIQRATKPGTYTVQWITYDAVGSWELRIYSGDPDADAPHHAAGLVQAALMFAVAAAAVTYWRRRTKTPWRWFWIGAAVWTVAVVVKILIALPLNGPIVDGLRATSPTWLYLILGMAYGGLLTGLTEVQFTYWAGLRWRSLTSTPERAIAIGIGAGAFEAAMLALAVAVSAVAGKSLPWLLILAPVVERIIALLCHVASRALALLAVARQNRRLFWLGLLLLSGVDAVAMLFHLTGWVRTLSPWVLELLLAPFAVLSVPVIVWCIRHWPTTEDEDTDDQPGRGVTQRGPYRAR